MDVNSMSTCRHFVRAGLGWSILTYMGLGSCKDRDIYVSPLRSKDGTYITRDTNMVYTKDAENLVVVKTFIEYVRDYYKKHTVVDDSIFREYKAQTYKQNIYNDLKLSIHAISVLDFFDIISHNKGVSKEPGRTM